MRYEFLNRKVMSGEIYREAVEAIARTLESKAKAKTSLLLYGSLLDDRLMPGVSDIDLILFFWEDFVLDPRMVLNIGESLAENFKFLNFDAGWFLDVSILDRGNAGDGRFIPYNDNFSKVFATDTGDAKLIFGEPFLSCLNPVSLVDPGEARIAFNLQSLRSYILFGRCNKYQPVGGSAGRELKILQQVRSLSRKVVDLINPNQMEILKDKRRCILEIKKKFTELDFTALDEIENLFADKNNLINALMGSQVFRLLSRALTCYESILEKVVRTVSIRSYREKKREERDYV